MQKVAVSLKVYIFIIRKKKGQCFTEKIKRNFSLPELTKVKKCDHL